MVADYKKIGKQENRVVLVEVVDLSLGFDDVIACTFNER